MYLVPVTYRPASQARRLDQTFERFFNNLSREIARDEAHSPSVDVIESDAAWTLRVDLPGVAKEDVKVSIDGKRVSIEAAAKAAAEPKDGERVVYRERSSGRFARTFTLPGEIDQTQSQAKLENGVLELTLNKRQAQAAQLEIH